MGELQIRMQTAAKRISKIVGENRVECLAYNRPARCRNCSEEGREGSLLKGTVLRAQNSFFYVDTAEGIVAAKLRGRLKKARIAVVPGDEVELELLSDGTGVIERRGERKNLLRRPAVANVDQVVLVFAACHPDINEVLVDRFLVLAEWSGIRHILLCINKSDLVTEGAPDLQKIIDSYTAIGYDVLSLSAQTGKGIEKLKRTVTGKTSVFAGPSGVGKSSLLNAISPGWYLSIGSVSEKIKRGRHTTRVAQLLPFVDGFLVDTPGFSATELADITPAELASFFPEFRPFLNACRFNTCTHSHEPGCAVKEALNQGKISVSRYTSYLEMLQESAARKKVYR